MILTKKIPSQNLKVLGGDVVEAALQPQKVEVQQPRPLEVKVVEEVLLIEQQVEHQVVRLEQTEPDMEVIEQVHLVEDAKDDDLASAKGHPVQAEQLAVDVFDFYVSRLKSSCQQYVHYEVQSAFQETLNVMTT